MSQKQYFKDTQQLSENALEIIINIKDNMSNSFINFPKNIINITRIFQSSCLFRM